VKYESRGKKRKEMDALLFGGGDKMGLGRGKESYKWIAGEDSATCDLFNPTLTAATGKLLAAAQCYYVLHT